MTFRPDKLIPEAMLDTLSKTKDIIPSPKLPEFKNPAEGGLSFEIPDISESSLVRADSLSPAERPQAEVEKITSLRKDLGKIHDNFDQEAPAAETESREIKSESGTRTVSSTENHTALEQVAQKGKGALSRFFEWLFGGPKKPADRVIYVNGQPRVASSNTFITNNIYNRGEMPFEYVDTSTSEVFGSAENIERPTSRPIENPNPAENIEQPARRPAEDYIDAEFSEIEDQPELANEEQKKLNQEESPKALGYEPGPLEDHPELMAQDSEVGIFNPKNETGAIDAELMDSITESPAETSMEGSPFGLPESLTADGAGEGLLSKLGRSAEGGGKSAG